MSHHHHRLFSHRKATLADIPAIETLVQASIERLLGQVLPADELAASYAVMGVDSQLIKDGDYFLIYAAEKEKAEILVGCGGFGRRQTLFGGNHTAGRSAALLNPGQDAGRIRAMYTHPDWARRGIGRLIMALCEDKAREAGFTRAALASTLSGLALYRACGYREVEHFREDTALGASVPLIRMEKDL